MADGRYKLGLRLVALASVVSVPLACSFAWDDYRPEATGATTGTGASGSSGSGNGGSGGCTSAQKVCGGQCVDIDDPAYGCTEAGCQPCSIPNATATCSAGSCVSAGCLPGYGDCDDTEGCETSTNTSSQHCGGCDQPCLGTSCINGACSSESCINGVDDDDDGLVDCADTEDCVTFECVIVDPPWKGPVFLYDGAYSGMPPDCGAVPGSMVVQGFDGLMFEEHTCSACACGQATVTCSLEPLLLYSTTACGTSAGSAMQPSPGNCGNIGVGVVSVRAEGPSASGSCAPGGGVPQATPYTWDVAGIGCEPSGQGAGCAGMGVCVGNSPPAFGPTPCLYRSGDQTCPSGFEDKHLFYEDASDGRTCTACQCSAPGGTGSCSATTHLYPLSNCAGTSVNVSNNGNCVSVTPASIDVTVNTTNNYSDCSASGGMPTGTVQPSNSVTVCCRQ